MSLTSTTIAIEVLGVQLLRNNFSLNFSDSRAKLIQPNMTAAPRVECLPVSSVLF